MKPLVLESSQDTPSVILDPRSNQFIFEGTSMPENSKKFFEPIFSWIEAYVENPNEETIVDFKMKYFNTSSTKSILDIMILFKGLAKKGKMLIINWYFFVDDEDMMEAGEGFSKMVRYPFNFIKY